MTADTSAIVAAASSWHARHATALAAVDDVDTLVAHAELEAYSVLTRVPAPRRVRPELAAEHLRSEYPGDRLVLPAADRRRLVRRLAAGGISGGAVYDALIALTAAEHDLPLVTCDQRAVPIYRRLGVDVEVL